MKKRDLETDLLSPKYRQRVEKTKKVKLREIEKKEATKEIRKFLFEEPE